jgi:hypothetical protein
LVTVSAQEVMVLVLVEKMVEVVTGKTEEDTTVDLAGQLVTVGAQLVMVVNSVLKTVLSHAAATPARARAAAVKCILS